MPAATESERRSTFPTRALLESSADAMLCVGSDGLIVLVNTEAELLFGYNAGGLCGRSIWTLIADRDREEHQVPPIASFVDLRRGSVRIGGQLMARHRDGTDFPVEISLSAFETDAGTLVAVAVHDLSDRLELQTERQRLLADAEVQRLERRALQSQRLESLGQLAGGVAHDFNNLLGAIINYTHFVAEELAAASTGTADRDWPAVLRDVNQIQLAAERATALTHQLLAFARREIVRPVVIDLNEVIGLLEPMLRLTVGEHIELVTALASQLAHVKADPGHIEQVLVNLAANARDAMPHGGTLTIDTANETIDERNIIDQPDIAGGDYVRLRVTDTGTGMPPEVVQRAFEPFFTTKPSGEGSGLGLATVHGIVSQAGGFFRIESEPGVGTAFCALLPATTEPPEHVEQVEPTPASVGGETVLLVEDQELMREVATRLLTRNGYRVIAAADGPSALTLASAHDGPIHLLLTDVVMPKMLGPELAERMVALRPAIRVLFMSGYAQTMLGAMGNLEPGVSLVEKPFSESALLDKVLAALEDNPSEAVRFP